MKLDFEKGFTEAVAAGAKEWEHDRSSTVGASEVFGCIRQLRFKKLHPELAGGKLDEDGEPEEEEVEWGHAERGNLIENFFAVPHLRTMAGEDRCLYMGENQKTLVDGRLSATPDGLLINLARDALEKYNIPDIETSEVLTEIKTFNNNTAPDKNQAKPRHIGQVNVQARLIEKNTNYKPKYGVVLYINPVNLKDIRPRVVKIDPAVGARAAERAAMVFDPNLELKDFLPEGKITGKDCNYCEFVKACHALEMEQMPEKVKTTSEVDPVRLERIEKLTKEVTALRKEHKHLEEKKKEVEAILRAEVFEAGAKKLEGDDWGVNIYKSKGKKKFNKEALAEDHPEIDLSEYETEGDPFYVMRTSAD